MEALQAANSTLDDVPSELASTLATVQEGRPGSEMVPRGSITSGFGSAFGAAEGSDGGLLQTRRPFGAERHPSMHIAAQIASATTLTLVPPSAAVVTSPGAGSGMTSIIEAAEDGGTPTGVSVVMTGVNGVGSSGSKSVTIKVEGE